jgi:CheY-like chemotaxis protein
MASILAIEGDRRRQTLLKALIREHVQVEVTVVDSVKGAIASFSEHQPDLIIVPTLLSPADSDELASHVKLHAEPHVQMLTISALDILRESSREEKRSFTPFRRPISLGLQYDPHVVGKQIAERLERAQVLREEYKWAPSEWPRPGKPEVFLAARPVRKAATAPAHGTSPKDRRWAPRTPQQNPWVWTARLPWGADVDLVNISRTGVLLESGSKVSPGVTLELQLSGLGVHRMVMARFVRSEIARVDRRGVRYQAAAQFEQPLDILPARNEEPPRSIPESLTDLLRTVLSDCQQAEAASIRFARGLRGLLNARDVIIGRAPIPTADGSESIYFTVAEDRSSRTILQVLFARDRALTSEEFKVMKAAAKLTAGVLELERLSAEYEGQRSRMSEVA